MNNRLPSPPFLRGVLVPSLTNRDPALPTSTIALPELVSLPTLSTPVFSSPITSFRAVPLGDTTLLPDPPTLISTDTEPTSVPTLLVSLTVWPRLPVSLPSRFWAMAAVVPLLVLLMESTGSPPTSQPRDELERLVCLLPPYLFPLHSMIKKLTR